MKLIHSPAYEVDIGPHVFPTAKYRLIREKLIKAEVGGVLVEVFLAQAL